ncbi:MAG: hypothetical protein DWQ44_13970 [Bacteroidetes bacterium]|nr:MAG: hypothetical protein DWQ33_03330 [Bacteroidota bacterium]REK07228.1 MAG: hypothetical protein DWQ39_01715 [Bacteroidota bacterium]REK31785.1 MAG: hypothetical protein DWQ44_13970 [Bacteroidota bacterium]REK48035.1 MAG: hypothetical protein DWQ48_11170 [Bacteroidota bacterium]
MIKAFIHEVINAFFNGQFHNCKKCRQVAYTFNIDVLVLRYCNLNVKLLKVFSAIERVISAIVFLERNCAAWMKKIF